MRRAALVICLLALVAGTAAGATWLLTSEDPELAGASPSTTASTSPPPSTTSTSTSRPPTTTTTVPPTTATTAPVDDGTLRGGDGGPEVLALQQRLVELGYWLGEPDGNYGGLTEQAVLAFQKAEGLGRDGVAGPATRAALDVAARPTGRTTDGIEIDLERQLLLVVDAGTVTWAINTSTGRSGWRTPPGTYAIEREIDGLRRAPLGDLYRPKYFQDGYAVHGSHSIPAQPASHGCARVSNRAMDMLWSSGLATIGTTVSVY